MKRFHAHIYFENQNLKGAMCLFNHLQNSNVFSFFRISEKPIGPHPLGMIEVHFDEFKYELAVKWLRIHRNDFSVLIHQDTGDDFLDHHQGIIWFGKKLSLDFAFFERIKQYPELRIHDVAVPF